MSAHQKNPARTMQRVDWTDLKSVIAQALRFGPGMVVVKHEDRANFNITHAERPDLWDKPGVAVLFRT